MEKVSREEYEQVVEDYAKILANRMKDPEIRKKWENASIKQKAPTVFRMLVKDGILPEPGCYF